MNVEFYKMLIGNAETASKRARWILSLSITISIIQLSAVFNFAFSQLRPFIESLILGANTKDQSTYLYDLQSAIIRNWVDHLSANINLLGIKVSAFDATIFGSLALSIISIWLFFAIRRENHIIGKALSVAASEPQEIKAYLFFGLSNSQVFATLTDDDTSFQNEAVESNKIGLVRALSNVLLYVPAISMGLMLFAEVYSLFGASSVFRGKNETFFEMYVSGKSNPALLDNAFSMFGYKFIMAIIFLIFICFTCHKIHRLQQGTQKILRDALAKGFGNTFSG